jgi:hypothetical protein
MRTFSCTKVQDASDLPWVYELPAIPSNKPVWGVNIVPWPVYASYTTEKTESGMEYQAPVGEPLYYEWSALLDPADTPLPDWITEVIEPPISDPSADSPGLLTKLKSSLGF